MKPHRYTEDRGRRKGSDKERSEQCEQAAGRQKRKEVRKRTKSARSKTQMVTETTYVIKVK